MTREQIERAEAVAARLTNNHDIPFTIRKPKMTYAALVEARKWKRPKSLATGKPKREYVFTEEQLLIAARALANEQLPTRL
jgi:hypothetical protein